MSQPFMPSSNVVPERGPRFLNTTPLGRAAANKQHATEATMPHLSEAARDIASDLLAAVGTSLYFLAFLAFLAAIYSTLGKLAY
jgi:hypothetical protein